MERYDQIGHGYGRTRRADPRIAAQIAAALGPARVIVNVGAGTGNYEPTDRRVVAVEPSETMIAQRPAGGAPTVRAVAEALPFADNRFDAAMAVLTVHHWTNFDLGVEEIRRVARRQVVLMFEPAADATFWLAADYLPKWLELDASIPGLADLEARLDVRSVEAVPVPADCTDGFGGAFWNRPEMYLKPAVRAGISSLARMEADLVSQAMQRLQIDLESGAWDLRYGYLRQLPEIDLGYRLIIAGS